MGFSFRENVIEKLCHKDLNMTPKDALLLFRFKATNNLLCETKNLNPPTSVLEFVPVFNTGTYITVVGLVKMEDVNLRVALVPFVSTYTSVKSDSSRGKTKQTPPRLFAILLLSLHRLLRKRHTLVERTGEH
ncbi:hypothetical protein MAR_021760 [Mya arenaria]|uniref:Uncharacterized protein n=1 Tax=Mya arenaria TaxID=6604 RepID=A0ABY7ECH0_MYAAR|nr:hypothetical protein MAR_021760 [Mya arenaria]